MNESEETLEQLSDRELLINLTKRLTSFEKQTNTQLEAIRSGLVANHAAFDRLQAKVLNIGADLSELSEEVRKQRTKETLELKN